MPRRVSIVVPFYNEEETVGMVLKELIEVRPGDEIVAVNDGSSDKTWDIIESFPEVTGLNLGKNIGQSGAIYAGMHNVRGDVVVLIDGDGQNDPRDIEKLLKRLKEADVVCGYRLSRRDNWNKRVGSKVANFVRRLFLADGIRDTGCSLKAFRSEHVKYLPLFNGMHRFIPAIFLDAGLKIVEVGVNHRERKAGVSKYTNWGRAWRGLYDIFGISWYLKRKVELPLYE